MSCAYPWYSDDIVDVNGNKIPIPCGKCYSCRMDMQESAVNRMFCAWKSHDVSAFVTFTYDDQHLPFKEGFREPTLSKDDVRKYLDNIRHKLKCVDFEYYLCGEYGDKFNRPHYHAIFFGLDYQYHEQFFIDSWSKGSVKVLPVNSSAFRYVAKYMAKGISSEKKDKDYYDFGLIPPFRKMSRGLGVRVYLQHLEEIDRNGYFIFYGKKISVNRYYFNKLIHYSPESIHNRERNISFYDHLNSYEASVNGLSVHDFNQKKIHSREESIKSRLLRANSKLS